MTDYWIEKASGKWLIYVDGERILRCDTRHVAFRTVKAAVELMQQPAGDEDRESGCEQALPRLRQRSGSAPSRHSASV